MESTEKELFLVELLVELYFSNQPGKMDRERIFHWLYASAIPLGIFLVMYLPNCNAPLFSKY